MKKLVSLFLAVALMASLLGTVAAVAEEAPNGTYTMFMRSTYIDWIKELKWYDVAEERTGIHVEYVYGPEDFNDCYSEVDQRIISDTLPDAVMTKLTQTNVYGPEGVFVDLAPYIAQYAPNMQAYIDANPNYKALVTSEDGAIYGLCKETPIFADLIGYRVDHFEAAGIDPESIVTVEDFTNALRTIAEFIAELTPLEQKVFHVYYEKGQSLKDTAQQAEITSTSARGALDRIRAKGRHFHLAVILFIGQYTFDLFMRYMK